MSEVRGLNPDTYNAWVAVDVLLYAASIVGAIGLGCIPDLGTVGSGLLLGGGLVLGLILSVYLYKREKGYPSFEIFVRDSVEYNTERFSVTTDMTVKDLKAEISPKFNVKPNEINLFHQDENGANPDKSFADFMTMKDCNVTNAGTRLAFTVPSTD